LTNDVIVVAKSQGTLETAGHSTSLTKEKEFSQMVSESRDLSIMRLAAANIVGVPCVRRKVERKEARKGKA